MNLLQKGFESFRYRILCFLVYLITRFNEELGAKQLNYYIPWLKQRLKLLQKILQHFVLNLLHFMVKRLREYVLIVNKGT